MVFAFADFELDPARFELRRAGVRVAVQPKVLRLLLLLVSERARALDEHALMRALWPNEKVGAASIKRAVMGARAALGDRGQTFIRTVRGHGYQFVHPLREGGEPLIGREGLLAELDRCAARAAAGEGQLALIVGAPGLGKTRLLHELASRAHARGVRAWWGRCMELDGAPPYWPLTQVLRSAAESDPELDLLLVRECEEEAPAERTARFRLFDRIACALVRAAAERPLWVLLDDLQSADQPTLHFLSFLAGQLPTSRLLVVATARPADDSHRTAHERLVELAREGATRSFALAGLSRADVGRYLCARFREAPAEVVARLHEQTGGNPLFLEEILRVLTARHADTPWDGLEGVALDVGLRGAIERHLAVLDAGSRRLVAIASVLGRDFSWTGLSELARIPPEDVLAGLQRAVAAEVVHRSGERHRFQHVLIHDVLYEGLDARERAQLHLRAANMLEAAGAEHGDDVDLTTMAEHFWLALPAGDSARAERYTRMAGERALQRFAYEEAARDFGRALSLWSPAAGHGAQDRSALALSLAEAQLLAGDAALGRATLRRAASLARAAGSREVLVGCARVIGRGREAGTVDHERVALLREGLEAVSPDDPQQPVLTAMLAKSMNFSHPHQERAEVARRALAGVARLSPVGRAEALLACHEALTHPELRPERLTIARSLAELAREQPNPCTQLAALTTRFENALERGETAIMREVVDALRQLDGVASDPFVRWYGLCYSTTCAVIAGRFAEAEACAERTLALGSKLLGEGAARHFHAVQINGMQRLQGKLVEAERLAREIATRFPLVGWRAWLACLQLDLGQPDAARAHLRDLIEPALEVRDPYWLAALCPLAELCARIGDEATVRLLYDTLAPYAELHGSISFGGASYGPISLYLARLSARLGEGAAVTHARAALQEAERMESPTFQALACIMLAVLGVDRHAMASRARDLATSLGMHSVLSSCQQLLGS